MPIYAYKCDSCGLAKDVLQKISDPLLTQCPSCGAATFSKQLTAAGFQLKGSGWYATDFKGSPPAAAGSDSAPSESKPSESASGKTESAKSDAPAASATPAAATTPAASS